MVGGGSVAVDWIIVAVGSSTGKVGRINRVVPAGAGEEPGGTATVAVEAGSSGRKGVRVGAKLEPGEGCSEAAGRRGALQAANTTARKIMQTARFV